MTASARDRDGTPGPSETPPGAPLVTLCVNAYRQEATVRRAVESALAQTYAPLEIILSDDASPDGTFAVMEEMAAAYEGPHRLRLNRNPRNLGIMGHYRRLWELASGELVLFCAGDDASEPHRTARLVEVWRAGEGRITGLHSSVTRIDRDGRPLGTLGADPGIVADSSPLNIIRLSANCIGATAAWDRRLHDRFGPLPEDCIYEDGPLFFRAAMLGEIAYVDEPLVRYGIEGASQRKPVSPGHDHLRGDRMRRIALKLGNRRAFLQDMEKMDFPQKAECRAECLRQIEELRVEHDLWLMTPLQRIAAVPGALTRSLATRRSVHLRAALKHALGPLYILVYNLRRG